MRLRRLDLLRYGRFTDGSLDLPAGKADLHVVFGPNEAGKSTALAAIEDLLFGIPSRSPYNFLHSYEDMRIGAVIENGGDMLEVRRRKGNKDTLLGPDGSPVPAGDGALRPYLADAYENRDFFERMFSLDRTRLEAGGREILEGKGDIGRILFSAGTGIAGPRDLLEELLAEARELWRPRRAKDVKFYIALDKLEEARRELREHTLNAESWRKLKQAHEKAEEDCREIEDAISKAAIALNRTSRIRRVFGDIRRKQELDEALAELGDAAALPEDAEQRVADAEREDAAAAARIAGLKEQLQRAEKNLEDLTFDEAIVRRADDIRQIAERRIEIRAARADLPEREAELHAAEAELKNLAAELEWDETDPAALADRIPPRTKLGVVRALLTRRGELEGDVSNKTRLFEEAGKAHAELIGRLGEAGEPVDASRLANAIKVVRGQGDIAGRVRQAEREADDAQGLVRRRLDSLNPGVADESELAGMAVPARAQLQTHLEDVQDRKRRLRDTQQRIESMRQELDGAAAAHERAMRDEQAVTAGALQEARGRRDELWDLVKLKYVDGRTVPDDRAARFEKEIEDLPGAFGTALAGADELADRRFEHAEAAGRIAEIARQIDELGTSLEQARADEEKLVEEGRKLEAEWASLWSGAPFDPSTPEAMLEWIEAREEILTAVGEREKSVQALAALRSEEAQAGRLLLDELAALGAAGAEKDSLPMVAERAEEELRIREAEGQRKSQLKDAVGDAADEVARRQRDLEAAEHVRDEWRREWAAELDALGLSPEAATEAVSAHIDIIDQMRDTAGRIASLRHERIEMIRRAVSDFEAAVDDLLGDIAPDLRDKPADGAAAELETRLQQAEDARKSRTAQNEEIKSLSDRITGIENEIREREASISHLMKTAGAGDLDALRKAIEKSSRRRRLRIERQEAVERLRQAGDGKPVEELEAECDGQAIDEVIAEENSLRAGADDLRHQQIQAAEARSQARREFQAVGGGDDAAAQAAAKAQEALAEMRSAAERYALVKTSAILLQWAIDRYRRENQAPLLKRAGEFFRIVTGDSFAGLQVEFDEQDNAYLAGVRPDDSVVDISGMSSGTADQLYLSLRIAAVEEYLDKTDALPFIADDLFVNFDDERAAAGFRLLERLAGKTQVLFFTHHRHLAEMAKATLDASVNCVSLGE